MSAPISTIAEIGKHEGQSVTIRGWLYNLRESGKLLFPIFRDGSGQIQGVVPKNAVSPETFDALKGLTQESSVIVEGRVRADKRAPGGFELDVSTVQVLQKVAEGDPYPITPKEHGVDFLMEHRHLWIRSPRQASILRLRAEIIKAARDFFDDRGFTLTDPPILTPAACEGTTTLFPVDYFDEQAYLTQSGQLYIEATAMALGKVYSFGPTFRAEKSKTRRHLTEFWMVEPEVAYGTLDDIMKALFRAADLPIVKHVTILRSDWDAEPKKAEKTVDRALKYPVFVKPANLGSSVGISKARSKKELGPAIYEAAKFDRKIVIEQGVGGAKNKAREIECSVLGNDRPQASVAGEIVPVKEFYDYSAKYLDEGSELIIPAKLTKPEMKEIQELAIRAFQAVDCSGLARVDFLMPAWTIPSLAYLATAAEIFFALALLIGIWPRWIALGSALLLAMFATAMAISFGIKDPLDYSVYSSSAAAFLLAMNQPSKSRAA